MYKFTSSNFQLLIFLLFVTSEVFTYGHISVLQISVTCIVYLFLIYLSLFKINAAVIYFISFTLLSFGSWSYVVDDVNPGNYWGLRMFGVSVNFLVSIYLTAILMIKNKSFLISNMKFEIIFLFLFFFISFFLGLINVLRGLNHYDNFIKDAMIYFPIIVLSYILNTVNDSSVLSAFKNLILATLFGMLLSLISGIFFEYSSGFKFILLNGIGFLTLLIVPFTNSLFSRSIYFLIIFIAVFLLATGSIFTGGKFLIMLMISLLWFLIVYKRKYILLLFLSISFLLTLIYWDSIINFLSLKFEDNKILSYKFSQLVSVVDILDIELIAKTPTSIGNIFAESLTVFNFFLSNPSLAIFGLGFGGGVPDIFGYLTPYAKPGLGYADIDAIRNNFFRMHLPLIEFWVKLGIFGLFGFLMVCYKNFKNNNIFSFFFFLVFFNIFINNKEMILLALFFLRLSEIKIYNKTTN